MVSRDLLSYMGSSQFRWKKIINHLSFNFGITGQLIHAQVHLQICRLYDIKLLETLSDLFYISWIIFFIFPKTELGLPFHPRSTASHTASYWPILAGMSSGEGWGLWPFKAVRVGASHSTYFWSDPWMFPAWVNGWSFTSESINNKSVSPWTLVIRIK